MQLPRGTNVLWWRSDSCGPKAAFNQSWYLNLLPDMDVIESKKLCRQSLKLLAKVLELRPAKLTQMAAL